MDNEIASKRVRPKWTRWKNQARETNKKQSSKAGPLISKHLSSEAKWDRPDRKKAKMISLLTEDPATSPTKSPSVKFKLKWELIAMEVVDVSDSTTKDVSTEAGGQPCWMQ